MQARGLTADQLLGDTGTNRLVALASLADSISFLADDMASFVTRGTPGEAESAQARGGGLVGQRSFRWKGTDTNALLQGLAHLVDQCAPHLGQHRLIHRPY